MTEEEMIAAQVALEYAVDYFARVRGPGSASALDIVAAARIFQQFLLGESEAKPWLLVKQ